MRAEEKIFIDIGSSTVKVYRGRGEGTEHVLSRSIPFKKDFAPESGVSDEKERELYELIYEVQENHPDAAIKTYATALFRKLTPKARRQLVHRFYERTGLYLNVIDQELESFYLQVALVGRFEVDEPVLLINVGGGSTELVVMYGSEAIETREIDLGVGTLLSAFENSNEAYAGVELEAVMAYVSDRLPELENSVQTAFYSGGELTYMKRAGYALRENDLFDDPDHPVMIEFDDFAARNREIFEKVSLEELEAMMPENPRWMHGARACSGLAQAICGRYGVQMIVPSDGNLVDRVVRQRGRFSRALTRAGNMRCHSIRHGIGEHGLRRAHPRGRLRRRIDYREHPGVLPD